MTTDVIPPATGNFLLLGLAAITVIMGSFVTTLWLRFRNLRRDEAALEQVARED